ncbi:MAG: effector-associated constant component EACC1 [Frankiaceae bacterium]
MGDTAGNGELQDLLLVWEPDPEIDQEEAERLGQQLRAELNTLDVESVATVNPRSVPAGAKGDPSTWTSLLITFSAAGGVFPSMIGLVQEWLRWHAGSHRIAVTIDGDTVEMNHASAAERSDLLDAYVRRHTAR